MGIYNCTNWLQYFRLVALKVLLFFVGGLVDLCAQPAPYTSEQLRKDLSRDNFSVDNLRWVFDGRKIKSEDLERLKPTLQTIIQNNSIDKLGLSDEALVKHLLEQVFIIK